MTMSLRVSHALRAMLLASAVAISACANSPNQEPMMKDNPVIANLRPWCIGRMVFDRPAASSMHAERYEYAGSEIVVEPDNSKERFDRLMAAREKELREKKRTFTISYKEMLSKGLNSMDVETSLPYLEKMATPSPNSRLFIHVDEHVTAYSLLLDAEGYILAGRNLLKLKGVLNKTAVDDVIRRNSVWYKETVARDDWTVPTERGFCIKSALIGGPPFPVENVKQIFQMYAGRPALFSIKMRNSFDFDQKTSLLNAIPDLRRRLDKALLFNKVRVLRAGKREFAGMQAEEVLLAMKDNGVEMFRFHLIAPGTEGDNAKPYAELELRLGAEPRYYRTAEQSTSLVDEAGALQAWDTLLDSFRLRPGAL
ncbi:T6SS immunity protein Tli4 family protein [Cupriavidus sp. 2SB]|uniref:T6SS immunity protein Tli4 family protein n=1 Tax=unclassified Cupriavidus TaxID=2640874 RepID=UPI0010F8BBA3|nr:T6SS immunity protein Tli4 family protein [Cupriavidus sp. 2SB]